MCFCFDQGENKFAYVRGVKIIQHFLRILFLPIVLLCSKREKVFANFQHKKKIIFKVTELFWKWKLWPTRRTKFADFCYWTHKNKPVRKHKRYITPPSRSYSQPLYTLLFIWYTSVIIHTVRIFVIINNNEYLLMGWRESHFSLKSQQYMTYTPPDQWILIEIEIFQKKFLSVQYTCWLLTRVFRKSIIHIYKIYNMWTLQEFFCCWHKGILIFKCLFVETLQFVTLCSFSLQDSENWKQLTFRLKKFISSEKK